MQVVSQKLKVIIRSSIIKMKIFSFESLDWITPQTKFSPKILLCLRKWSYPVCFTFVSGTERLWITDNSLCSFENEIITGIIIWFSESTSILFPKIFIDKYFDNIVQYYRVVQNLVFIALISAEQIMPIYTKVQVLEILIILFYSKQIIYLRTMKCNISVCWNT